MKSPPLPIVTLFSQHTHTHIHTPHCPMPMSEPTSTLDTNSDTTPMSDSDSPAAASENPSLNIHRGAIDQTTVITTREPKQVMERMGMLLQKMGMHVTKKGWFLYRCSALKKEESSPIDVGLF